MKPYANLTTRSRGCRMIPRVEQLEDRCVPACTVTPTGAAPNVLLTINGDAGLNAIQISDNGAGNITVTCDGVATPAVAGVRDIVVNTQDGNDVVFYTLTADLTTAQVRNLNVDLGAGNDFFLAQATNNGDVNLNATLTFNVRGRLGNDNIRFFFSQDFDIFGTCSIFVAGNEGRDRIAVSQLGEIDGRFSVAVNGGADRDRIGVNIAAGSSSAGNVAVQINGQGGDDLLTLLFQVGEQTFTGSINAALNGGPGINTAVVSDIVVVTGVFPDNVLRMP